MFEIIVVYAKTYLIDVKLFANSNFKVDIFNMIVVQTIIDNSKAEKYK
jgi:hypothetical protein